MTKSLIAGLAAFAMMAGTAQAVTVVNKDDQAHKIGIDMGTTESVKEVPAGKSLQIDCPEGCGVTGPWNFSWMAKGSETITTDGSCLVCGKVDET
jgi:hypothetical protein